MTKEKDNNKHKWLFRIMSDQTFKESVKGQNIFLELKHPSEWNPRLTNLHKKQAKFEALAIEVPVPTKIGVTDPFEGIIPTNITSYDNRLSIEFSTKDLVSKNIRAICFSEIEATEEKVKQVIEEEVKNRNYGKHYIYCKSGPEDLCSRIAGKNTSLVSFASCDASYYDPEASDKKIIRGTLKNNKHIVSFEEVKNTIDGKELGRHYEELEKSIPIKHKSYQIEKEVRILAYCTEWNNNERVCIDNSDNFFHTGVVNN